MTEPEPIGPPEGRHYTPAEVWIPRFMEATRLSHNMGSAAQVAGVTRQAVWLRIQNDPAFREEFEAAKQEAIERLEGAVFTRGISGDQRAAEFYLKAHKPELYNVPARVHLGGPGGGPLDINVRSLLDERLAAIAAKLAEPDATDPGGSDPGAES